MFFDIINLAIPLQ